MREISQIESPVKVRKQARHYDVSYAVTGGRQKKRFENLSRAREFALSFIGRDVEITNKKGIVIPL